MNKKCTIIADKAIKAEHVEAALRNLIATVRYGELAIILRKQLSPKPVRKYWGWEASVDIFSPKGNKLVIQETSSEEASVLNPAKKHISKELQKQGYKTKICTTI